MGTKKLVSFIDELEKIAADVDWKVFEKNLRKKSFQKSLLADPRSDAKLKKYVKNVGGYYTSKEVVAIVPSRSSAKTYKIKKLPSGRLACGCPDWRYTKSVGAGDCFHIKSIRKEKKAEAVELIAKGANFARLLHPKKKQNGKTRTRV